MSIPPTTSSDDQLLRAPIMPRRTLGTTDVRLSTRPISDEYLWLDQQVFDRYPAPAPQHDAYVSSDSDEELRIPESAPENIQPAEQRHGWRRPVGMLLYLVPRFVYNAIERRSLYIGSQHPEQMRCDLNAQKEEWAEAGQSSLAEKVELVSFKSSSKVRNHGWYVAAAPGKPTFVVSSGNMQPLTGIEALFSFIEQGYGFLNYEYPGFGSTRGTPNEKSLYRSLEAARNFLNNEKKVPDSMQIGYGTSLGGAVTVDSAAKRPFKAVILESTLASVPDTIRYHIGTHLPAWLADLPRHARSKFNSLDKISHITSPLLIMHGTHDPLIPSQASRDLYARAGTSSSQKWLRLFSSNEHNLDYVTTHNTIQRFLRQPCITNEPSFNTKAHVASTLA